MTAIDEHQGGMRMKKTIWGTCIVALIMTFFDMSVYAFDGSGYKNDDSYVVDIDDMDGTGWIYKENLFFDIETESDDKIEMYYALYMPSENEAYPMIHITTYTNGISSYDKVIFKTSHYRYTFDMSNVSASLTDDKSGLNLVLYLFDMHAMEMLKDFAQNEEPVDFRVVCSGKNINGTLKIVNPDDLIDFYEDYEHSGGFNQGFFEKYSDAGNYLCSVVDLLEKEEETKEDSTSVEISYSDKLVIAIVQQALTKAGYDSGKADGVIGSRTTTAISNYQSANGMEVTGTINDELVEKLGVGSEVQAAARKEASKNSYQSDVTYEQLSRNPDLYNNTKLTFRGKVLQDIDQGDGKRGMRLAVNSDYDQVIYVFYDSDLIGYRILEDDQITVYGKSTGIYTYTSTMKSAISIPSIYADILEIHY